MNRRRKLRRTAWCWLALSPLLALTLWPFAVMLSTALKSSAEVIAYPPHWVPVHPVWSNFPVMWHVIGFGQAALNSLFISTVASLLAIAIAAPAAYALSRFRFRGQGGYRQFLLATQMLSPILLVLGLFRMAAAIPFGDGSLVDTRLGVILIYSAYQLAFAVWMLAAYFGTIPKDLEEAAWIDGATRAQAVMRIFLPLSVPALTVTGIVTFVAAWNEFVVALTLLRDPARLTLQLKIVNLVAGRYTIDWNQVMAAGLLATLPVALLFAVLQRYLVGGLTLGAVK